MSNARQHPPSIFGTAAGASRAARGFTLTELLVAVGVVVLLTLSIGQIFRQVGKLVSTGSAVAEVDQMARAIERQMREDFAAINRLRPSDTFFAIRSRALGDNNLNDLLNDTDQPAREKAIYLSQEDKDFDVKNNIQPYGTDISGKVRSRAVTIRIDEMIFIGQASEKSKYTSYQQPGREANQVSSELALLRYGHGLKPAAALKPDGNPFDPTQTFDGTNRPVRQLVPDGFDVSLPAWGDYFGMPNTRNEFAGGFSLLRQPMLLLGGRAAGNKANASPISPILDRNYAATVRDRESAIRASVAPAAFLGAGAGYGWNNPSGLKSRPRLLRWGRTDICAQSLEEVRRWLEGVRPADPHADATAFDSGVLDVIESNDASTTFAGNNSVDSPLFDRGGFPVPLPTVKPIAKYRTFRDQLQSAIAGCFTRMLCEPGQTYSTRFNISGNNIPDPDTRDAVMDQHALFADRCSNFEIAWSDGTTCPVESIKFSIGTGAAKQNIAYYRGETVWFDRDFTKRQYNALMGVQNSEPNGQPDPEIISNDVLLMPAWSTTPSGPVPFRDRGARLVPATTFGGYDAVSTGGNAGEYLAVWGFRPPDQSWDLKDEPWVKPKLIRVRMTLHDAQFKIPGGKQFEFIFRIDQSLN